MVDELGRVRAAVEGDRDVLAELLQEIGPAVRQWVAPRINKRWQAVLSADDVMQETYADAFLSIGGFEPDREHPLESLTRWLATIGRHNLLDAVKALKAARAGGQFREVGGNAPDASYFNLLDYLSASATTPSGFVRRGEAKSVLEAAIDKLPASYREVVLQYDIQGLPIGDVARDANCSEGAIYMRRSRAHAMLRELLGTTLPF